ncbi:MAG: hypothetical protein AB1665_01765 [Candidatus Thermoplasmatota archaeon]
MKEFFERLNALGKPKRTDIIEKDFHLHRLLGAMSADAHLHKNLAFKGGTCLIKVTVALAAIALPYLRLESAAQERAMQELILEAIVESYKLKSSAS